MAQKDLTPAEREAELARREAVLAAREAQLAQEQAELAGVQGGGELVAALEHFEDEIQVVAAVGLVEVLHILQHGGGDALEAGCAVSLENFALNVVAQGLLVGQKVAHTF